MLEAAVAASNRRSVKMEPVRLAVQLTPQSLNAETGDLQVVWATEDYLIDKLIQDEDGGYGMKRVLVRLSFEKKHIRSERLDRGLHVIHNHGMTGLANPLLGRAPDWKIEGSAPSRRMRSSIRFSKRQDPAAQGVIQDIRDGILIGLSFGTWMYELTPTGEARDGLPIYLCTDWEPFEITFGEIPRNPMATTLAAPPNDIGSTVDCIVLGSRPSIADSGVAHSGSNAMKPKGQGEPAGDSIGATGESTPPGAAGTATLTAPPGAPNEAQLAAARGEGAQQAEARERARCTAILSLATKHSLDDETREQLLSSGASIERAHEVVLDKIHERTTRPAATAALSVGAESRDHVIAGAEGAILLSLGYRELDAAIAKQREEKARPFRGLTMVELARKFLEVTGKRTEGLSRSEVCRLAIGMHGTSDFPKIFANVQNKFLQEGYDAAPSSFEMLARVRSAKDFKTIATNHAGLGSRLAEMQEGAPVTYGTITEGGETYAVKRYGKGLTFSIEAMLNDDLDALSAIPRNFGVQTRVLTNRLAWALPIANAAMADGVVIFHATHANLITDSLDDATALKNARIKLRLQTEPDGSVLNLSPAWLIVPPTLETLGRQLVSSEFNPSDQSKINTFKGLGIIVEQELESASGGSAAKWYMTCAKEMIPAFEVAYLEGKKVPTIDSQTDFDSDALKTKATFVVGLCVPNHRAWVHSNATT